MKATVDATQLKQAIQMVAKAVSHRGLLPILSNVRIVATDTGLALTGTDLEISIETKCPARVSDPGSATVDAKRLLSILKLLPAGEVTLWLDDTDLIVSHGAFVLTMFSLPAHDFPDPPMPNPDDVPNELTGATLAAIVGAVKHSCSPDAAKSVLGGVHLQGIDGAIVAASTDGYRLSVKRHTPDDFVAPFAVTIPILALIKVVAVMDPKDTIAIYTGPAVGKGSPYAIFRGLSTTVTIRCLEGKYPDYDRIVPRTFERQVIVDRAELKRAIALATVFATDRSNIFKMAIDEAPAPGRLLITADTPDCGKAAVTVVAEVIGESLDISFNAMFIADTLRVMTSDKVKMQMGGAINPILMMDPDDESATYLQMPIRP